VTGGRLAQSELSGEKRILGDGERGLRHRDVIRGRARRPPGVAGP
jgi:hypothetical protein